MQIGIKPLPFGVAEGGTHVHVAEGRLTPEAARQIVKHAGAIATEVVVTPWHGIFIPQNLEATP